jgi:hypothetical protein
MDGINSFLKKLNEESDEVGQEDVSKNIAKEDALSLVASFVKDVKKKFSKMADRLEIMNAANKTLGFYINEIESGSVSFEMPPVSVDVEPEEEEEEIPPEESSEE